MQRDDVLGKQKNINWDMSIIVELVILHKKLRWEPILDEWERERVPPKQSRHQISSVPQLASLPMKIIHISFQVSKDIGT